MTAKILPIDYKKNVQSCLDFLDRNGRVVQKQKDCIRRYVRDCYADGLSHSRVCKYITLLMKIAASCPKPFEDFIEDDLKEFLRQIEFSDYSPWTKRDFRITIKRFWRWLERAEDYPRIVKWIKTTLDKTKIMQPSELLNEKDIGLLIEAAAHPRDRAIIAVAWETGCRAGELLTLRIRSFKNEGEVCQLDVMGKTGARRVPIVASVPHLTKWLSFHPDKDNPDSPLWMSIGPVRKSEYLTHPAYLRLLKNLARKVGVNKRIYPHLFRHSRATFLANHFTEAQLKHFFGWTQRSNMAATYVHLSGRDIQNSVLSMYGRSVKNETNKPQINLTTCGRCGFENSNLSKYCSRCGSPSTDKEVITLNQRLEAYDNLLSSLLSDKNVQKSLDRQIYRNPGLAKSIRLLVGSERRT